MTYGALTNEVGYITDIPWLLGIYRSKTTPSPSGCALGFGVVFDNKSLQPWYNYCIYPVILTWGTNPLSVYPTQYIKINSGNAKKVKYYFNYNYV